MFGNIKFLFKNTIKTPISIDQADFTDQMQRAFGAFESSGNGILDDKAPIRFDEEFPPALWEITNMRSSGLSYLHARGESFSEVGYREFPQINGLLRQKSPFT